MTCYRICNWYWIDSESKHLFIFKGYFLSFTLKSFGKHKIFKIIQTNHPVTECEALLFSLLLRHLIFCNLTVEGSSDSLVGLSLRRCFSLSEFSCDWISMLILFLLKSTWCAGGVQVAKCLLTFAKCFVALNHQINLNIEKSKQNRKQPYNIKAIWVVW